jgi:uncharacterized damage-inducible protein DinB
MQVTEMFIADLERETASTRSALERVPEGRADWKPHEKSMSLGNLATLVATLPSWIDMIVNQDELDMHPPGGPRISRPELKMAREFVEAFDSSIAKAKHALGKTNDEHLMTPWRLLVNGHVVNEQPRHIMIRDAVLSHLAHHRGQLTVYLRLNEASVPAIYGPSADEGRFE